jgi:hypothetical protein
MTEVGYSIFKGVKNVFDGPAVIAAAAYLPTIAVCVAVVSIIYKIWKEIKSNDETKEFYGVLYTSLNIYLKKIILGSYILADKQSYISDEFRTLIEYIYKKIEELLNILKTAMEETDASLFFTIKITNALTNITGGGLKPKIKSITQDVSALMLAFNIKLEDIIISSKTDVHRILNSKNFSGYFKDEPMNDTDIRAIEEACQTKYDDYADSMKSITGSRENSEVLASISGTLVDRDGNIIYKPSENQLNTEAIENEMGRTFGGNIKKTIRKYKKSKNSKTKKYKKSSYSFQ